MKKRFCFILTLLSHVCIIVILILLMTITSASESLLNDELPVDSNTNISEGNPAYQPLIIMCQRQGKCLYKDGLSVEGKTLLEYGDNNSLYEWYIVDEGNNQYSIRYYNTSSLENFVLSCTSSGSVCLELAGTTLNDNQKWVFDYADGEVIIGAEESTRIKNVSNNLYLFGRDDGGITLTEVSTSFPDAQQWKIEYSLHEDQNVLTSFKVY